MTTAIAGIQARMGSSRLPGKSLADLAGKPMLQRVAERALAAKGLSSVVVLTTTGPHDDAIASFCGEVGLECRRGSETDVLSRYLALVDEFDADYLVRITGDCPLISPDHIDFQVQALRETDCDFTCLPPGVRSTVLEGQGAMSVRALRRAGGSDDPRDREHVGSFYFNEHVDEFRHVELSCAPELLRTDLRITVDQAEDLELLRAVFHHFAPADDSLASLAEVLSWLDSEPSLARLNRAVTNSSETRLAHESQANARRAIAAYWPVG